MTTWYGKRNEQDFVKVGTDGSVTTLTDTRDELGAYFWFDAESCGVHEYTECSEEEFEMMKLRICKKLLNL